MDIKNGEMPVMLNDKENSLFGNNMSKTIVIRSSEANALEIAALELTKNNVIALPTDTVYGLACSAISHKAIKRLYDIKGREETKPVAICVATLTDLRIYGEANHLPEDLLHELLPGAVTIVLNRTKHLNNPYLNKCVVKIGIRIPDSDFIHNLSTLFKLPIALTSANKSSEKSTLSIQEFQPLWPKLGAVIDGGLVGLSEEQRAASTVVDLSRPGFYKIIRDGVAVKRTVEILRKFNIELDAQVS